MNNQTRDVLSIFMIGLILVVFTYLFTDFVINKMPVPFGTFEDFSVCCP